KTSTSTWTGSYTTLTTVTGTDGVATPVVEVPGVKTSTSTWTGSFTTLTTVTGTDGVATPVVEVPGVQTSTFTWTGSYTTTVTVTGTDGVTTPVVAVPVSASFTSSMPYHSGGWNSSYVQSSITKPTGAGYSSSSRSPPPGAVISSVSMSQYSEVSSPVTETRTFVTTISGASGAIEVVTSTITSTFCPESTSSKPSYTTDIFTSVATINYGHGSSKVTTLTVTSTYCPEVVHESTVSPEITNLYPSSQISSNQIVSSTAVNENSGKGGAASSGSSPSSSGDATSVITQEAGSGMSYLQPTASVTDSDTEKTGAYGVTGTHSSNSGANSDSLMTSSASTILGGTSSSSSASTSGPKPSSVPVYEGSASGISTISLLFFMPILAFTF
ncbi:hypothetical protein OXX59_009296, partial [Metschnikowia pulcherrima]